MFGSNANGAKAYVHVGEETGVVAASPHQLIVMLFDGAIISVRSAIDYMKAGQVESKGNAISRAILIIDGGLELL